MKTLLNLLNRTANTVKISGGGNSRTTKHLVLFMLLFALGVGEMWANTTHPVYCAIRPSSLGETGELYLNVHKGTTSDGGVWYQIKMTKIATTIHKAETGETKDLYVASIEYVEVGLQQMEFQIYDAAPPASPRETHVAFNSWTTSSDTWTKQVFDYENGNFTTYPASLTQKKSYVYFDAADWNDDVKQLVISHGTYRGFNNLNHLSNTTLYYANPDLNWGDAVCISFIGNSTSWSETGKWLNDIPLWSHHYTGYLHYSLSENSFNYFARRSGDEKGAALSYNYWGTESTAYQNLNKTQTVQARVKATGSSYSDASFASWPGTVSVERTYMSSATATTSPSAANMTSATTDAVLTSSITLTASANSGYYFEGWGDASDSNPTDGTTAKTYSVTDTKTSYAFFSQTYTLTYDRKGDYSTSTLSVYSVDNFSGSTSSGSSIPAGHLITLVATPATGYEVEGWYSDAACTSPYTNGSGGVTIEGNTFKLASLNANTEVYCKFRPISYIVTLQGMEADDNDPIEVNITYNAELSSPVSGHTKEHYDFRGYWTDNNDAGATLVTQLIDDNYNWKKNISPYTSNDETPKWIYPNGKSLFAKWEEKSHDVSVTISPAGAGSVQISSLDVTEVTAGEVTWSSVLTPIAKPGWKFKEWQKTSSVDFDLEHYHSDYQTSGTNSMAIKAYADGQTLTAVFEPRYYLVGGELVGDDDNITTSGMPGWGNYDAPFIVTTSSPLLATCTRTLTNADKTYKILVRDKNDGISYGVNTNPFEVIQDGESLLFDDANYKVYLYAKGGTTFTFKITDLDATGHPYVSLDRPHQMHMGHKRVDIGSGDHNDNTGGTLTASTGGNALANNDWFNYGSDIAYTATAQTGYTLTWYTNSEYSSAFDPQPGASWTNYNVTGDENIYAQFTEISTSVTLSATNGQIKVGDTPSSETTCGVTTTRSLTAVPNDGYMFSSWTKTSGSDYDLSTTSDATTTLTGLGGGESSGQTVTANFALRWALKAESDGWGSASFDIDNISTIGGDAVGYVDITLAANTNYQFTITDKQGSGATYKSGSDKVYYMTNGNSYVWNFSTSKTYNCGITTAGAGTYRFMWNITDKTMSVIYPNFVIYRSGDKDEDSESASHTTTSAVESYAGGTINQGIEFRMKVRELDKWYTLCLPFTVSAVKVWDEADGAYYDIYPYYRSGGNYIAWHYIIRTPKRVEDFPIAEFDDWDDPIEKAFLPSENTPYIIQWHDSYFTGKYISFFGGTGQPIPTSMTEGIAPSSDNVVNVHGNDAMKSGTIRDAYLLENDYGTYGAWLREDIGTDRTILPFECYIRAKAETAARYRVLRRDMTIDDTPTGLDQIINRKSSNRKFIKDGQLFIIRDDKMYNVYGMEVQQ